MVEASIESLPSFAHRHRCAVLLLPLAATLRPPLHTIRAAHVFPSEARPVGGTQILEDVWSRLAKIDHVSVEPGVIADPVLAAVLTHRQEPPRAREQSFSS